MQLGISTHTYGWAVGTATAYRSGDRSVLPMDEQTLLDQAVYLGVRLVQFGDNLPLHELSVERSTALQ